MKWWYLHNLAYKIIIHRGLSLQIFFWMTACERMVFGFRFAKLAPEDKASVEMRLAGIFGYLAP